MPDLFLVMLGGALGAGGRFLVGKLASGGGDTFPWATLGINLLGGLLMGMLAGALSQQLGGSRQHVGSSVWLFVGVGVLGGFTTFSAFSLDAVALIARGATGAAMLYVGASVLGALALFAAGQWLTGQALARAAT